jgi:hypothetical protein
VLFTAKLGELRLSPALGRSQRQWLDVESRGKNSLKAEYAIDLAFAKE